MEANLQRASNNFNIARTISCQTFETLIKEVLIQTNAGPAGTMLRANDKLGNYFLYNYFMNEYIHYCPGMCLEKKQIETSVVHQ